MESTRDGFLSEMGAANCARIHSARNRLLGLDASMATAWEVLIVVLALEGSGRLPEISNALSFPENLTRRWLIVLQERGLVRLQTELDEVVYEVPHQVRDLIGQIFG